MSKGTVKILGYNLRSKNLTYDELKERIVTDTTDHLNTFNF